MLDVCNGRFSVLEIILEDRLYKTVDTATGSLAAVKRWESGDSSFENELSALTSLRHPSVPQFICSFEEGASDILRKNGWTAFVRDRKFLRSS